MWEPWNFTSQNHNTAFVLIYLLVKGSWLTYKHSGFIGVKKRVTHFYTNEIAVMSNYSHYMCNPIVQEFFVISTRAVERCIVFVADSWFWNMIIKLKNQCFLDKFIGKVCQNKNRLEAWFVTSDYFWVLVCKDKWRFQPAVNLKIVTLFACWIW